MGIGTLGFLRGATRTGLDSIEAREEAEREIQKQKQLEELRARLRKEAELATVSERQYETREGVVWSIGYNSDGHAVKGTDRPATQFELDKIEQEKQKAEFDKKKQSLDLQRLEVGILNDQDQIRSRQVRDANDTRSTNAQIAASNRVGRSGGGSKGGGLDTINLSDAPQLALSRAAEEVINVDPGIGRLLGDYAIPAHLVEAIKKDAIGQALRDPNAKTPAARAQAASSIMRRVIMELGNRYPKENK